VTIRGTTHEDEESFFRCDVTDPKPLIQDAAFADVNGSLRSFAPGYSSVMIWRQ